MGFNLGIAAGAAADSYLKTQKQQQELARQKAEQEEWQRQTDQRKAIDSAIGQKDQVNTGGSAVDDGYVKQGIPGLSDDARAGLLEGLKNADPKDVSTILGQYQQDPQYGGQAAAIPAAVPAPAPIPGAPEAAQPTAPAAPNPYMPDHGNDMHMQHSYLGGDGQVYMTRTAPTDASPGMQMRNTATRLMGLKGGGVQAYQLGTQLLQNSYAINKQEHEQGIDDIVGQVQSGKMTPQEGTEKLGGVWTQSGILPGEAKTTMSKDGTSAVADIVLPDGRKSTQKISGADPMDTFMKAQIAARSMYNPSLYLQAAQNKIHADTLVEQIRDHTMNHQDHAETIASQQKIAAGNNATQLKTAGIYASASAAKGSGNDAVQTVGYQNGKAIVVDRQGNYSLRALPDGVDASGLFGKGEKTGNPNATMTDQQKIAYTEMTKQVGLLGPNAKPKDVESIKKQFGFGGDDPVLEAMKAAAAKGGDPFAPKKPGVAPASQPAAIPAQAAPAGPSYVNTDGNLANVNDDPALQNFDRLMSEAVQRVNEPGGVDRLQQVQQQRAIYYQNKFQQQN